MITTWILALATIIFSFFRQKFLMLFFQQKEYKNTWFLKYVFGGLHLVDKKLTLTLIVIWVLTLQDYRLIWLMPLALVLFALRETLVLKKAKKSLAITTRVKRILGVSMALTAALVVLLSTKFSPIWVAILTIQFAPFSMVLANILLSPMENRIQKKYLDEAKQKLKTLNPTVIGITGSYGKTSTKHILAHILSGNLPVLWTPGSVNTEMGITRIVREKLAPEHKYFIVEMGAYFKGSIKKLCDLANPKHGIITAIGQAHYEHFRTQETIAEAKFELGDCVTKNEGTLVLNMNQIEDRFVPTSMAPIRVGDGEKIHVSNVNQTRDGLYFTFHTEDGESHSVFAPIFGVHQVQNMAVAMEMALKLGMPMKTILATLKTLPQINHRLEVLRKNNDIIIIDDAYNSNFDGFKSGLELLQPLRKGRRILITPGMVELGNRHDEQHYEIGKIAGASVDIAIVVRSDRVPTFVKGFRETAPQETQLLEIKSFKDAQAWMDKNLSNGDVVLLENDLPDVYESRVGL